MSSLAKGELVKILLSCFSFLCMCVCVYACIRKRRLLLLVCVCVCVQLCLFSQNGVLHDRIFCFVLEGVYM